MKIMFLFVGIFLVGCSGSKVKTTAESTTARKTAETTNTTPQAQTPTGQLPAGKEASEPAKGQADASKAPPATTGAKTICRLDKDERVVEKVATASGCELKYTKFGETSVIASSTSGPAHCDRVYDQIKANLEKYNYKCE